MEHKERKTEAPAVFLHRGPALSTLPEEGTLDPEVVEERRGGRNAGGAERARQTSNGEAALGLGTRLASRCRASPDSLPACLLNGTV